MRLPRFSSALICAVTAAVLIGCLPESRPSATPEEPPGTPGSSPTESIPTPEPSLPAEPSDEPLATPSPSSAVDPSPSESAGSDAAADCSGSDDNRSFFAEAADTLQWTVYCATLPSGWFVVAGQYRRAGGGWLEITYRGPGGARFELHEGAFCQEPQGCVPAGIDAGEATFGDRTGTLVATVDGGWALIVDDGAPISWLAVGSGLSEDRFREFTAALTIVAD